MPSVKKKNKSKRAKARSNDSPMPQGGAGLIRFYQDESNGIKITPLVAIILAVVLMGSVILLKAGVIEWIFG